MNITCVPELSAVGEYILISAYIILFSFTAWVIWRIFRDK